MISQDPVTHMPVGPRAARAMLLFCTLLVAVCGFVYQLILIALGSVLIGNAVTQAALVLACFVSAMGVGSLISKPLMRNAARNLIVLETAVAVLGGLSALGLYVAFAWLDLYQPAMLICAALLGTLIGAEIPLLMHLIGKLKPGQEAGRSLADLLAADYLGAVVAGLAVPLLVLPALGEIGSALACGALNLAAAVLVWWLCRKQISTRAQISTAALIVLSVAVTVGAALLAGQIEVSARQVLYEDPVVYHERSKVQEVVVTQTVSGRDLRLYLNGDLQFSSVDEYRYHESLVHPAMADHPRRVVIFGGGDGLALREVLKHPGVQRVVQVDLDRAVTDFAARDRRMRRLNDDAYADRRVTLINADAFSWVREYRDEPFDAVIADFPDPDSEGLAKLYSQELYGMIRARVLAPAGRMVVQAGSPYFAAHAFWSIDKTIQAAGLRTRAYHVDVPSFGDWGFVLAGRDPQLKLAAGVPRRFLTVPVLQAAQTFPADRAQQRFDVDVNTLNHPRLLDYERRGWKDY